MGRMRGCLWLTAGLIVALLAGFVGYATLQRATGAQAQQPAAAPQVPVVVAAARGDGALAAQGRGPGGA